MQALDLNLASHPFKNNTLLWTGFAAGIALLAWITLDNVATWQHHRSELHQLESEVGGIEARQQDLRRRAEEASRQIRSYDLESLAVRADKANEVIRWKAFSWTSLFNRLEEVLPDDVQMASIHPSFRPDGATRSGREELHGNAVPVVVDGTARNLQAFLDLERALIRSPYFERVEPERTATDPDTNETVFGLRFFYNPDLPEGPPPRAEGEQAQEQEQERQEAEQAQQGQQQLAATAATAEPALPPPAEVDERAFAAEAEPAPAEPAPPSAPEPTTRANVAAPSPQEAAPPAAEEQAASATTDAQQPPRVRRVRKPGSGRGKKSEAN